jgi:hypothetical protein
LLLSADQKGFEYALWPASTVLPSGIFSWWEAVSCTTSPAMIQYGHVIYDAYMASSYILFYLICWLRSTHVVSFKISSTATKKTKKEV